MDEKVHKTMHTFGLAGLFTVCFIFFLYFTFPYVVLKETITSVINKAGTFNVRIEKLGPSLPLGFDGQGIEVSEKGSTRTLRIESAEFKISLLSLLIGRLGADIELGTKSGGELNLGFGMGIFQVVFNRNITPSRIVMSSRRFEIDDFVNFALGRMADDPTVNPLVAPLLSQVKLNGLLDGDVDLALDVHDPTQSKGSVNLDLKQGALLVTDPGLNIAAQNFEKFLFRANMDRGKLVIDKNSGLKSQGLVLEIDGKVDLKDQIATSQLNLNLAIKLTEALKDNFGFIVDAAMGGQNGEAKMQVLGTVDQPRTVAM